MAYVGLTHSLRGRTTPRNLVVSPISSRILEVSDLVMGILRLAARGNATFQDAIEQVVRAYMVSYQKAEVLTLEAINKLSHTGLIQISDVPLPEQQFSESHYDSPGRALVNLTYRCNLRCIHCLQGSKDFVPPPELDVEDWIRIVRELADYGVSMLFISGGEPLLRKDLLTILREAADHSFTTRLYTNATLMSKEFAKDLAKVNDLIVQVSMHGVDGPTCDSFVGLKGAYSRITDSIRTMSENGLRVSVATCFRDEIIHRMEEIPPQLIDMGVREWVPTLIMPMGCAFQNWSRLRVSDANMRIFMETMLRLSSIYKGTDFEIYTPFDIGLLQGGDLTWQKQCRPLSFGCDLYGQYINIDPMGNLHPCDRLTDITLGNLKEMSLTEIMSNRQGIARHKLHNVELMKNLGILERCQACRYKSLCGMSCPAILFQGKRLGEEEYDPIVCRMFRTCFDIIQKYSTAWTQRRILEATRTDGLIKIELSN